jgi:hypothetical protein
MSSRVTSATRRRPRAGRIKRLRLRRYSLALLSFTRTAMTHGRTASCGACALTSSKSFGSLGRGHPRQRQANRDRGGSIAILKR